MRQMLRLRARTLRAASLVPVLSVLGACTALPRSLSVEPAPQPAPVLEGYVARSRLDPDVAGTRARVDGLGARLLVPVDQIAGPEAPALSRRLLAGGFFTSAPGDGRGVAARHYGAQVDLRLTERPLAGRLEPLVSLGVGQFRARLEPDGLPAAAVCLRPVDLAEAGRAARCLPAAGDRSASASTALALSPSAGVRLGLLPGLAIRADARDVVVYRGAPRHNPELAVGLSFVR